MDDQQLKMRILDFIGFTTNNHRMLLDTKDAAIVVDFGATVFGQETFIVSIQQQGCDVQLPAVRTVGDLKRLYRVLTGKEWSGADVAT